MNASEINGELIPVGGGDTIPLVRAKLILGRRESCDVCLRFPNISGKHCELKFDNGLWWVYDLGSTNGIKVNGIRASKKLLHPGDKLTIGKRTYTVQYNAAARTSHEEDIMEEVEELIDMPLLEKAGLEKRRPAPKKSQSPLSFDDDD